MATIHLPPHDARSRLSETVRYVDVRTPEEFAEGHPQGALNIPVGFYGPYGMTLNPHFLSTMKQHFALDATIVLGCRSGGRSASAADLLAQHGFTGELINVLGGYHGGPGPNGQVVGWRDAGLPTGTDGTPWADLAPGSGPG